jgi:hypothetical protein
MIVHALDGEAAWQEHLGEAWLPGQAESAETEVTTTPG